MQSCMKQNDMETTTLGRKSIVLARHALPKRQENHESGRARADPNQVARGDTIHHVGRDVGSSTR